MVIVPYLQAQFEEVSYDELTKTERGQGGFGSSGR
jgi:dUTPase